EIPGAVQIADSASIDPAPGAFELVDQLHRADLGRSCQSPRREAGGESVDRGFPARELAADLRDQVLDVRIALDLRVAGDADAADFADAAEIVAAEVDQYDVLRPLLRVGEKARGESGGFLRSRPAADRTRDRARFQDRKSVV